VTDRSTVEDHREASASRWSTGLTTGLVLKLAFLGAVNAFALFGLPRMIDQGAWTAVAFTVSATAAIDYVYLSRRRIALKYILPGTVFLLLFQVYPVLYTAYISTTNYGTGNILTKDQAIDRVVANSIRSGEEGERYQSTPLDVDGSIALLLLDSEGRAFLGTEEGLEPLPSPDVPAGARALTVREAQDRQRELEALQIPVEVGYIRVTTFRSAAVVEQGLVYDRDRDVMVETATGREFRPVEGAFTSDDGQRLQPGWRVVVGADNFRRIVEAREIRGPFLRVFVWTYVFAFGSVLLTFALGLMLALTLHHPRVRGKKLYRSLLIIPYALPSFMSALIWAGLMNRDFGMINRMLGADVPWLTDPTMAKVSVLLVNLWLGFPYMFLVTTGALQSIPQHLREAALVDGADGPTAFRRVVFPLLMISVSPLLIASFAFNFNNFNVIYLLTRGRPPIAGAETPAGHTDILISYTYRLAFEGGRGTDYGFAAAISVVIFMLVATFSIVSFRYTRKLEDMV
jgi:arabinogalactan oligomer / maltooligosaccharide transport system permease protein